MIPPRHPRYEILESTGETELYHLFKAHDRQQNCLTTLRYLKDPLLYVDTFTSAWLQDQNTITGLVHPNIAKLYSVEDSDGRLFTSSEFVRGIDLKERIRRTAPFTVSQTIEIAISIAEALEYAHQRSVAHGDLRPENVLINSEGEVKITGWAEHWRQYVPDAVKNAFLARTIFYTAPELSGGSLPSRSTDLYALGAILYEMLAAATPFEGESPVAIAIQQAMRSAPSVVDINSSVPPVLDGIIQQLTAPQPASRYANATEVLEELRAFRDALKKGRVDALFVKKNAVKENAEPPGYEPPTEPAPRPVTPSPPPPRPRAPEAGPVGTAITEPAPVSVAASSPTTAPPKRRDVHSEERRHPLLSFFRNLLIVLVVAGITAYFFGRSAPTIVLAPNLKAKTVDEARHLAAQQDLAINEEGSAYREDIPEGQIYFQNPPPQMQIKSGQTINVWVSKGSGYTRVPEVTQLDETKAREVIAAAGLKVGNIVQEYNKIIPVGSVTRQKPRPGVRVTKESLIDLWTSKGEKAEPPPPPPPPVTPPVDTTGAPTEPDVSDQPDTPEPPSTGATTSKPRQFDIEIVVPTTGRDPQEVKIVVVDDQGENTVVDEQRRRGERISRTIQVYGPNAVVTVLVDGKKVKEQRL